jgi:hypothetical protein
MPFGTLQNNRDLARSPLAEALASAGQSFGRGIEQAGQGVAQGLQARNEAARRKGDREEERGWQEKQAEAGRGFQAEQAELSRGHQTTLDRERWVREQKAKIDEQALAMASDPELGPDAAHAWRREQLTRLESVAPPPQEPGELPEVDPSQGVPAIVRGPIASTDPSVAYTADPVTQPQPGALDLVAEARARARAEKERQALEAAKNQARAKGVPDEMLANVSTLDEVAGILADAENRERIGKSTRELRSDFEKTTEIYRETINPAMQRVADVEAQYRSLNPDGSLNVGSDPSDAALALAVMQMAQPNARKLIDDGSLAQQGSLIDRAMGHAKAFMSGQQMNPEARAAMLQTARVLYQSARRNYEQAQTVTQRAAERQRLPVEEIYEPMPRVAGGVEAPKYRIISVE